MQDTHHNAPSNPIRRRSFGGRRVAGIAMVTALAGLIAAVPLASAHGNDRADSCGMHSMHRDGPGKMEARMAARVDRIFNQVGASAEQRARAKAIVQASVEEMKALQPNREDGRKEMLALLSAETIDRDRIEQHRSAHHAQMEQMSKLMVRTVADLAEVLTPAQRQAAAKQLMQMGHDHHGRPGPRHQGAMPKA